MSLTNNAGGQRLAGILALFSKNLSPFSDVQYLALAYGCLGFKV